MAKISFGKTVKYQGSVYPPNTVFEVSDSDVADLQKAGGWVKEEPKTEVEPEKSELDLLRDEANELGIEYKGNWGVKKLTEAIAEAKAQ
jgi:hypothetical protein